MDSRDDSNDLRRVLFILGSGRNGSTLLATILASAPRAMTVGEAHWIWDRGLVENRLCGCGLPTQGCPFWTSVLERTATVDASSGSTITTLRDAALSGLTPFRLLGSRWRSRATDEQLRFMEALGDLYRHVAADQSTLIIDTSKRPTYGLLLSRVDGLDVRFVHLVRDSRAVAFSWLRKKPNPDIPSGGYMKRHSALMTSAGWNVWNLLSEWFWRDDSSRVIRVRYEDFMADPQRTIERIATFSGISPDAYDFANSHTVSITASHTISGNPSRFSSGAVTLHPDDEWKRRIRRRDMWVTTLLTWPELLRYGYKLRVRRGDQ